MKADRICKQCGVQFVAKLYPNDPSRGTYCSTGCAGLGRTTHGHSPHLRFSKTYSSWVNMVGRCTRPYHSKFARYGAVGIKVCDEWLSFDQFLADMGERPEGTTLDRWPDIAGDYRPGNCRWSTLLTQQRNTKANVYIEYNGQRKCIAEWAQEYGHGPSNLRRRLRAGWTIEQALTIRPKFGNRVAHLDKV